MEMSMSRGRSSFWGMRREDLEEIIEDLQEDLQDLKERHMKVVNLNVELMDQLKRQSEMTQELYRRLKEKDGEKEPDNLRGPRQKTGYA